ncbi:putative Phosphoinositide phosphatase SAC4 [Blattamonas nauphoetae]|uniref:Phosphoinositide phosphatase SAC4 n=1 Tax=Blattamonas nauphoetae TaxID=2049346 RepID=A0ABQ9YFM7_9EUKA|nr:putative Phosphoinositide phosphatase SAC4 [Blattamonas nauphoetae]
MLGYIGDHKIYGIDSTLIVPIASQDYLKLPLFTSEQRKEEERYRKYLHEYPFKQDMIFSFTLDLTRTTQSQISSFTNTNNLSTLNSSQKPFRSPFHDLLVRTDEQCREVANYFSSGHFWSTPTNLVDKDTPFQRTDPFGDDTARPKINEHLNYSFPVPLSFNILHPLNTEPPLVQEYSVFPGPLSHTNRQDILRQIASTSSDGRSRGCVEQDKNWLLSPPDADNAMTFAREQFLWNNYLLRNIIPQFFPQNERMSVAAPLVRSYLPSDLVVCLVNGSFTHRSFTMHGRTLNIALIARRSRHYAGTRYYKRGISERGWVANDVETELITWTVDSFTSSLSSQFGAFVQVRGSPPVFWSQDAEAVLPKPPIIRQKHDPYFDSTYVHFGDLFARYGTPIIALSLLHEEKKVKEKTREKNEEDQKGKEGEEEQKPKGREAPINAAFCDSVRTINQTLPPNKRILFLAFDFNEHLKHKTVNVNEALLNIAQKSIQLVGVFSAHKQQIHTSSSSNSTTHPPRFSSQTQTSYNADYLDEIVVNQMQSGTIRTNCLDCLDRTHFAQLCVLIAALFEILSTFSFELASVDAFVLVDTVVKMHTDLGDIVAQTYSGSDAIKKVDYLDRQKSIDSSVTQIAAGANAISNIKRFISNTFQNLQKQRFFDLFLGIFPPFLTESMWVVVARTKMMTMLSNEKGGLEDEVVFSMLQKQLKEKEMEQKDLVKKKRPFWRRHKVEKEQEEDHELPDDMLSLMNTPLKNQNQPTDSDISLLRVRRDSISLFDAPSLVSHPKYSDTSLPKRIPLLKQHPRVATSHSFLMVDAGTPFEADGLLSISNPQHPGTPRENLETVATTPASSFSTHSQGSTTNELSNLFDVLSTSGTPSKTSSQVQLVIPSSLPVPVPESSQEAYEPTINPPEHNTFAPSTIPTMMVPIWEIESDVTLHSSLPSHVLEGVIRTAEYKTALASLNSSGGECLPHSEASSTPLPPSAVPKKARQVTSWWEDAEHSFEMIHAPLLPTPLPFFVTPLYTKTHPDDQPAKRLNHFHSSKVSTTRPFSFWFSPTHLSSFDHRMYPRTFQRAPVILCKPRVFDKTRAPFSERWFCEQFESRSAARELLLGKWSVIKHSEKILANICPTASRPPPAPPLVTWSLVGTSIRDSPENRYGLSSTVKFLSYALSDSSRPTPQHHFPPPESRRHLPTNSDEMPMTIPLLMALLGFSKEESFRVSMHSHNSSILNIIQLSRSWRRAAGCFSHSLVSKNPHRDSVTKQVGSDSAENVGHMSDPGSTALFKTSGSKLDNVDISQQTYDMFCQTLNTPSLVETSTRLGFQHHLVRYLPPLTDPILTDRLAHTTSRPFIISSLRPTPKPPPSFSQTKPSTMPRLQHSRTVVFPPPSYLAPKKPTSPPNRLSAAVWGYQHRPASRPRSSIPSFTTSGSPPPPLPSPVSPPHTPPPIVSKHSPNTPPESQTDTHTHNIPFSFKSRAPQALDTPSPLSTRINVLSPRSSQRSPTRVDTGPPSFKFSRRSSQGEISFDRSNLKPKQLKPSQSFSPFGSDLITSRQVPFTPARGDIHIPSSEPSGFLRNIRQIQQQATHRVTAHPFKRCTFNLSSSKQKQAHEHHILMDVMWDESQQMLERENEEVRWATEEKSRLKDICETLNFAKRMHNKERVHVDQTQTHPDKTSTDSFFASTPARHSLKFYEDPSSGAMYRPFSSGVMCTDDTPIQPLIRVKKSRNAAHTVVPNWFDSHLALLKEGMQYDRMHADEKEWVMDSQLCTLSRKTVAPAPETIQPNETVGNGLQVTDPDIPLSRFSMFSYDKTTVPDKTTVHHGQSSDHLWQPLFPFSSRPKKQEAEDASNGNVIDEWEEAIQDSENKRKLDLNKQSSFRRISTLTSFSKGIGSQKDLPQLVKTPSKLAILPTRIRDANFSVAPPTISSVIHPPQTTQPQIADDEKEDATASEHEYAFVSQGDTHSENSPSSFSFAPKPLKHDKPVHVVGEAVHSFNPHSAATYASLLFSDIFHTVSESLTLSSRAVTLPGHQSTAALFISTMTKQRKLRNDRLRWLGEEGRTDLENEASSYEVNRSTVAPRSVRIFTQPLRSYLSSSILRKFSDQSTAKSDWIRRQMKQVFDLAAADSSTFPRPPARFMTNLETPPAPRKKRAEFRVPTLDDLLDDMESDVVPVEPLKPPRILCSLRTSLKKEVTRLLTPSTLYDHSLGFVVDYLQDVNDSGMTMEPSLFTPLLDTKESDAVLV